MDDIILVIRGQEFKASKAKLSEFSDYFRAMFSGNFVENEQTRIIIDVLDPNIISIILQYMRIGLIDLSEYSLVIIGDIAVVANFLQITELIKQIQYYLDIHLSVSNWVQTMKIAKSAAYVELEKSSAVHGLLSFRRMKPEHIPTIHKLFWYLSHPYLDAETEFEVFKFGHEWIMQNESGGDALLLILCCLDYQKLTTHDLKKMAGLLGENYTNSLAEKVIECLKEHGDKKIELSLSDFVKSKSSICKKYTEQVYKEIVNLIKSSITRKLVYTPVVPMCIRTNNKYTNPDDILHSLYAYTKETGFEKWLEIADKNLWGWSVISWGLTKLVLVCGERGRGTGAFMKEVKVYDVLKKEWIHHGVSLPSRRHAGLAILDDSLYLLGGVGGYRVVLDSVIVYDLNQRTFRKIGSLPDAIQSPAACVHNQEVYASGQKNIYKYDNDKDCWTMVMKTDIRLSNMVSFRGFLYCTQNYFNPLYRLNPDNMEKLEIVTYFASLPVQLHHLGDRMIAFTKTICNDCDVTAVEEYTEEHDLEHRPNVLCAQTYTGIRFNEVAGGCVLVMTMPSVHVVVSESHKRCLDRFPED